MKLFFFDNGKLNIQPTEIKLFLSICNSPEKLPNQQQQHSLNIVANLHSNKGKARSIDRYRFKEEQPGKDTEAYLQ